MAEDKVDIVKGQSINITMDETFLGTNEKFAITYPNLINDVKVGSKIHLDDGLVELEVTDILKDKGEIETKELNTGVLKDKKEVKVPNVSVSVTGMNKKDAGDTIF